MARIRTVKPEFWTDEDLATVSETARLVAIGLLNLADDEGYFNANPRLIECSLFPLTEPSVSIQECLNQLCEIGYLQLNESSKGKIFGVIKNFVKHQKVNRPTPSKIKELFNNCEPSLNTHGGITVGKERKGKEQGKEIIHGSSPKNGDNPSAKNKPDYSSEFEQIWQSKPEREGGNSKLEAYKAYCARIKSGVPHADLAAGVMRYRTYCDARRLIGSRMVKQLATFFGPDEHWKETWALSDTANNDHANGGIDWDVSIFDHQSDEQHQGGYVIDGEVVQ
ncbi:hypothetical protein [Shewanella sp. Koi 1]